MKSRKKIFNVKLYFEGIKQLKMIGIMSFVILALESFLSPLGINIERTSAIERQLAYSSVPGAVDISPQIYSFISINPLVVGVFLVVVPLMTLFLFNFMTRRNASDFYHSIPDTRECLLLSYGAAVLTWAAGLILSSGLITVVTCGFMKYVEVNLVSVVTIIFTSFAGSVYVLGIFLLAMSLSGTVFTNVVVAAMIMFMPRLILCICMAVLSEAVYFVPFDFSGFIFNDRLNVVTNIFTGIIARGRCDGICMVSAGIYTLIVGVIILVVAAMAFKSRKSEAATCAAINSKLQCVFRLIPAFVICLIPATVILIAKIGGETWDASEKFMLVVLYIVAIVAYFLYELITTKKWRNIIKAVPGLLILFALNVIYIFGMYEAIQITVNDVPDKADIQSVSICNGTGQDYFQKTMGEIKLQSEEAYDVILNRLAYQVEAYNSGEMVYWYKNSYKARFTVEIDTGIRSIYRTVFLNDEEYRRMMNVINSDPSYLDTMYTLPQIGKNQTSAYVYGVEDDAANMLYSLYAEEVKSLDMADYYYMVVEGYSMGNTSAWINVSTVLGTDSYHLSLPISSTKTPETFAAYVNAVNSNSQGKNPVKEFFKNFGKDAEDGEWGYYSMYFELYDGDETYYASAYYSLNDGYSDFTENGRKILEQIGEKLEEQNGEIDVNKPIVMVDLSMNYYTDTGDSYYEDVQYYNVDEELYELFMEYVN